MFQTAIKYLFFPITMSYTALTERLRYIFSSKGGDTLGTIRGQKETNVTNEIDTAAESIRGHGTTILGDELKSYYRNMLAGVFKGHYHGEFENSKIYKDNFEGILNSISSDQTSARIYLSTKAAIIDEIKNLRTLVNSKDDKEFSRLKKNLGDPSFWNAYNVSEPETVFMGKYNAKEPVMRRLQAADRFYDYDTTIVWFADILSSATRGGDAERRISEMQGFKAGPVSGRVGGDFSDLFYAIADNRFFSEAHGKNLVDNIMATKNVDWDQIACYGIEGAGNIRIPSFISMSSAHYLSEVVETYSKFFQQAQEAYNSPNRKPLEAIKPTKQRINRLEVYGKFLGAIFTRTWEVQANSEPKPSFIDAVFTGYKLAKIGLKNCTDKLNHDYETALNYYNNNPIASYETSNGSKINLSAKEYFDRNGGFTHANVIRSFFNYYTEAEMDKQFSGRDQKRPTGQIERFLASQILFYKTVKEKYPNRDSSFGDSIMSGINLNVPEGFGVGKLEPLSPDADEVERYIQNTLHIMNFGGDLNTNKPTTQELSGVIKRCLKYEGKRTTQEGFVNALKSAVQDISKGKYSSTDVEKPEILSPLPEVGVTPLKVRSSPGINWGMVAVWVGITASWLGYCGRNTNATLNKSVGIGMGDIPSDYTPEYISQGNSGIISGLLGGDNKPKFWAVKEEYRADVDKLFEPKGKVDTITLTDPYQYKFTDAGKYFKFSSQNGDYDYYKTDGYEGRMEIPAGSVIVTDSFPKTVVKYKKDEYGDKIIDETTGKPIKIGIDTVRTKDGRVAMTGYIIDIRLPEKLQYTPYEVGAYGIVGVHIPYATVRPKEVTLQFGSGVKYKTDIEAVKRFNLEKPYDDKKTKSKKMGYNLSSEPKQEKFSDRVKRNYREKALENFEGRL